MYVLSDHSQNMQGERIDWLCLEEPFSEAPSGVHLLEISFAFWGVRAECPRVGETDLRESQRDPHSMAGGSSDSPMPKEPTSKSKSSLVLGKKEEIQIEVRMLRHMQELFTFEELFPSAVGSRLCFK